MKARDARFFGNGNVATEDGGGKHGKAWQVTCRQCRAVALVRLSTKGFLPPNVVVKKFRQQGWLVGSDSREDLCAECQTPYTVQRPPESNPVNKKLLQQHQSMVAEQARVLGENKKLRSQIGALEEGLASKHFELIRRVHEHLLFARIDEALTEIEKALPAYPWPQAMVKEKGSIKPTRTTKADPDFDKWLNELEQHRHAQ